MSIRDCIKFLTTRNVPLDTGLTSVEMHDVERHFGFEFSPDHREFLAAAQPVGKGWWNWRNDSANNLRRALERPVEGILFDVAQDAFWPVTWGARPTTKEAQREQALRQLKTWPVLIPIFSHRYMPAAPAGTGAPVFSVHQSDVIVYGRDLFEYFQHELGPSDRDFYNNREFDAEACLPWSHLAQGLFPFE